MGRPGHKRPLSALPAEGDLWKQSRGGGLGVGGWLLDVHGTQQCSAHSERSEDAESPSSSCQSPSIPCVIHTHPIDSPASRLCALHNSKTSLWFVNYFPRIEEGNWGTERKQEKLRTRSWILKAHHSVVNFKILRLPEVPVKAEKQKEGATAKHYRSVALLHVYVKDVVFKNEYITKLSFNINDRTCFFNSWIFSFSWKFDLFLRCLKLCGWNTLKILASNILHNFHN